MNSLNDYVSYGWDYDGDLENEISEILRKKKLNCLPVHESLKKESILIKYKSINEIFERCDTIKKFIFDKIHSDKTLGIAHYCPEKDNSVTIKKIDKYDTLLMTFKTNGIELDSMVKSLNDKMTINDIESVGSFDFQNQHLTFPDIVRSDHLSEIICQSYVNQLVEKSICYNFQQWYGISYNLNPQNSKRIQYHVQTVKESLVTKKILPDEETKTILQIITDESAEQYFDKVVNMNPHEIPSQAGTEWVPPVIFQAFMAINALNKIGMTHGDLTRDNIGLIDIGRPMRAMYIYGGKYYISRIETNYVTCLTNYSSSFIKDKVEPMGITDKDIRYQNTNINRGSWINPFKILKFERNITTYRGYYKDKKVDRCADLRRVLYDFYRLFTNWTTLSTIGIIECSRYLLDIFANPIHHLKNMHSPIDTIYNQIFMITLNNFIKIGYVQEFTPEEFSKLPDDSNVVFMGNLDIAI